MNKLVYCAHSHKSIFLSQVIALFVLDRGDIPIDPFMVLPPTLLDTIDLDKEGRLKLDLCILSKCDYLYVFGEISEGVLTEIDWWQQHRTHRIMQRFEWDKVLKVIECF